ncbi:AP-3 complex subunit delta [Ascosphaera aggregata]|nr:AP-3 complex subunit delta [Ascosphaera aggregata]
MSLPLLTLPHIFSPSLALSLLQDLLSRLSHSNPAVRKKTIVNLYRLSLVYPEAFKVAWPRIKEHLMDPEEDSSVTAAVSNVVCELGWRRPHDFLPLAPRLFDLLVNSGNNWMAIKIIKLFATLTPLEPRLVKKLLRPLINLIQTTSAMSLLYECINGIIQGGILDGVEGVKEGEEVATLCVNKLRGMIVLEGDPNLKYVALLAFNRIARSHPTLVAEQQDVILDCLDDDDISNRMQALDLASVVVSSDTLESVVNHLLGQLQGSNEAGSPAAASLVISDDESDMARGSFSPKTQQKHRFILPTYYRAEMLHRILDMCSRDLYAHIVDFEWYVDVLVQLVKFIPPQHALPNSGSGRHQSSDIGSRIGNELLNVSVRVQAVRPEATQAAESLLLIDNRSILFPPHSMTSVTILDAVAFIVGEYAEHLTTPERTLTSLTHASNLQMPAHVLSSYLQAIPKVFIALTLNEQKWDVTRRGEISLALGRIVSFLESLSANPNFDVQERATEFLELLRLTGEAVSAQHTDDTEMPLLISSVMPGLFSGLHLNPVAAEAQEKVPPPENLDLEQPLNPHLTQILMDAEQQWSSTDDRGDFHSFYYIPDKVTESLYTETIEQSQTSQHVSSPTETKEAKAKRAFERSERARDDPFYIAPDESPSGTSTPFAQVLHSANGEGLDIDSIPVMPVQIDSKILQSQVKKKSRKPKTVYVMGDETIEVEGAPSPASGTKRSGQLKQRKAKQPLLELDGDGFDSMQLTSSTPGNMQHLERRAEEEAQMAKALAELQRKRLEMQRENERVQLSAQVPAEGFLVEPIKKKKKKKSKGSEGTTKGKKKHSKKAAQASSGVTSGKDTNVGLE